VIAVGGGTASGKTTLCRVIEECFTNEGVAFVPADCFYKDLNEAERELARFGLYDFDSPDAIEISLLREKVKELRSWQSVEIPQYDFVTHSRLPNTVMVTAREIIIVEGILVLYDEQLRKMMDLKVFVDCDADIRLARRVTRDLTERGRTLDGIIKQYTNYVKPTHEEFVDPSKRFADVIIPNVGQEFSAAAVNMLVQQVEYQLLQRRPAVECFSMVSSWRR